MIAPAPRSGEDPAADVRSTDLTEAQQIHDAVLDCADVAGVSAGAFGEIASYLPGRTVAGIRLHADRVEVHVVARYGEPLQTVVDQIGVAVAPWLAGRILQVAVEDILLPGEVLGDAEADGTDGFAGDEPADLPTSAS